MGAFALSTSFVFANNSTITKIKDVQKSKFKMESKFVGVLCTINIYRILSDGSEVFVKSIGGYADSAGACQAKAEMVLSDLNSGVPLSSIKY